MTPEQKAKAAATRAAKKAEQRVRDAELALRKQAFLADYRKLVRRHRVIVGACGCCGSPWLDDVGESSVDVLVDYLRQ